MKIGKKVILCLFLAALVCSSVFAGSTNDSRPCDYKEFGLDGSKFFVYMTKDTPYTGWSLWSKRSNMEPAQSPHGPLMATYVNPAADDSIKRKGGMAFGSLIVVENRASNGTLTSLDARIKIKGYHPQGGDWYWFRFSSEGMIQAEGKAASCLACHEQRKENDYLMTAPVK
jgi:hypothetical protein